MASDSAVFYIALVGIIVVAILFVLEVRRWRDVQIIITRRQRILRVFLLVLIELLFLMVLVGPRLVLHTSKLGQLVYWSACLLVGLAILVIALVDLRAVVHGLSAFNRQMCRGLREDDDTDE